VLKACQANSQQPCKLYAVDDYVVWSDDAAVPANLAGGERREAVDTGLTASLRGR